MRALVFVALCISAFFLPFWCFALTVLLYTLIYEAYAPLLIAVCVDVYFGEMGRGAWYLYTLFSILIGIAVYVVRPYLRFY